MLKIKICGMKYPQNINSISVLNTDFIGFIFYSYSLRFIGISYPIEFFTNVKKVGIFVNTPNINIIKIIHKYTIEYIQLHGDENLETCEELYKNNISIIKVFKIKKFFYYILIYKYINYSILFLFETYHPKYGGSGKKFSWKKILNYTFNTQFILSGGINTKDIKNLKNFFNLKFFGIDLNSKFEIESGNKNRDELRRFINKINL